MKQFVVSLSIKKIKNIIHKFNEYIIVDVFMNDYIKQNDKQLSTIERFSIKIHIIENLKINLLLSNDVFNAQRASININIQIVTLIKCNNLIIFINIMIKKNVDQKRTMKIKIDFKLSIENTMKILIFFMTIYLKTFFRITISTIA